MPPAGQGVSSASSASSSPLPLRQRKAKTEEQLLAEENEILSANDALWEKVFASMDKIVNETTISTNYSNFLLSAVEKAKDQFSDKEYKSMTADAEKIRDIETSDRCSCPRKRCCFRRCRTGHCLPQV